MRLLLTSAGFENPRIGEKFIELLNKPVSEIKIIFVPTASRSKEELKYVEESKKEILDLGIKDKNIKVLNLDHNIQYEEVKDFDAIYVCGGNTFYLLDKIRKTGFDKILKQFTNENKLYIGVSAGSNIVCPNVEIALPFDENDTKLTDFTGLNLIGVIIVSHYDKKEKEIIDNYRKRLKFKIIPLTDNQAYLVLNSKAEIIQ